MRIKMFNKFIEDEACTNIENLRDITVAVDAQNFFYDKYFQNDLQHLFGCECDKYANYLRDYLSGFKKSNLKVVFFLKGGHSDISNLLEKKEPKSFMVKNHWESEKFMPNFTKNINIEVLNEMGFDFVVCENEAKKECIAFAQKNKCPIISYDIEFCFSGLDYIPSNTLKFDKIGNNLKCKIFKFDHFLQKFNITKDKLAILVVLTDQNRFPQNHFEIFLRKMRIPLNNYKRILGLIKWVTSVNTPEEALSRIFSVMPKNKEKFLEEFYRVKDFIRRQTNTEIPTEFIEDKENFRIFEQDPLWFEKGLVMNHITLEYVDLYRHAVVCGIFLKSDQEADDPLLLSIDIIKYAYDLMTNFQNDGISLLSEKSPAKITSSVTKPKYNALNNVFENGWDTVLTLKLFEHFFIEALQGFNFEILNKIPEDSRLLIIALIYFSRKKPADTTNEIYSTLISYVAYSKLFCNRNDSSAVLNMRERPILDAIFDKSKINDGDVSTAVAILNEYTKTCDYAQAELMFDAKLLHPLLELQHVIQHVNYLNTLCGCPFVSTVYSKTYNGTFVYKVLREIVDHGGDAAEFLKKKLNPAATVLAFVQGLIDVYEEARFA